MKKILLMAAGTATTWHFCQIIKKYFEEDYEIHLADINDEYLIPASIYAHKFHKVLPYNDVNYEKQIYDIIEKENIDIIVPLIDFDLLTFSNDNKVLNKLNCYSTAPLSKTTEILSNKKMMYEFLTKNGINTPNLLEYSQLKKDNKYIIKPIKGFGSTGIMVKTGEEILMNQINLEKNIIQEKCDTAEEITAEIYNGKILKIFQRQRVATKAGVCTKMIPVNYEEINVAIEKLISSIECPEAFCIQFMKNNLGKWCIIDCNLRIGAGTALSTAIGFQLVKALLTSLSGKKVDNSLFEIEKDVKSVLRVYEEIVIK